MTANTIAAYIITLIVIITLECAIDTILLADSKIYCYDKHIEKDIDFDECVQIIYKRNWEDYKR